jgi:hypothetical protein
MSSVAARQGFVDEDENEDEDEATRPIHSRFPVAALMNLS